MDEPDSRALISVMVPLKLIDPVPLLVMSTPESPVVRLNTPSVVSRSTKTSFASLSTSPTENCPNKDKLSCSVASGSEAGTLTVGKSLIPLIVMSNDSVAETAPSCAITSIETVPTSPLVGVPLKVRVLPSKFSQLGKLPPPTS